MYLKQTVVVALLVCLPLAIQAQGSTTQDIGGQLKDFQQKLDEAFAEAEQEERQFEAEIKAREAEQKEKGIVALSAGAMAPLDFRLKTRVEQKMERAKAALIERFEEALGMCVDEISFGFDPLPFFSMKLRSKPDEGC